jgi:hypothetical protein
VTWSILDFERSPKAGYRAVADACAPVIITGDRPAASYRPGERIAVGVHAVSDLRAPIAGATAHAVLSWPGGSKSWHFTGDVPADSCTLVGRLTHSLPAGARRGPLRLDLTLEWPDGRVTNSYDSVVA